MQFFNKTLDIQENILFKIIDGLSWLLSKASTVIFYAAHVVAWFIESFINVVCRMFTYTYTFMRWAALPYDWIIIRTWLYVIFRGGHDTPLDRVGVHFLFAPPGGFKSLTMKVLADQVNREIGKGVYLSHSIEKIKIDNEGNKFLYNRKIDIKSYFDLDPESPTAGQQIKAFNFDEYPELYLDEFHLDNNNRENKTKLYNLFFKPLLESFITMRHDGCRRIILASQVPSNDNQLMPMITGFHVLRGKKGIKLFEWLKTGRFIYRPIKVKLYSYQIDPFNPDNKKLERVWSLPISLENLEDFETYALRGKKDNLPMDYPSSNGGNNYA